MSGNTSKKIGRAPEPLTRARPSIASVPSADYIRQTTHSSAVYARRAVDAPHL